MTERGWRLFAHSPEVFLENVEWKVSEAGRQRVIREQRKNVHAFACGILSIRPSDLQDYQPISYNPYKAAYFSTLGGTPVFSSRYAIFTPDRKVLAIVP